MACICVWRACMLLLYSKVCFLLEVKFETEDNQVYEVAIPDETEDDQDFEIKIPKKIGSYPPTIANRKLPNNDTDKRSPIMIMGGQGGVLSEYLKKKTFHNCLFIFPWDNLISLWVIFTC